MLGKKALKGAGKTLNNGIKNIWVALPPKVKIIVAIVFAIIFFFACVEVVLADYTVTASTTNIENYVATLPESTTSSKFYIENGSMLFMKDEDIEKIAENYLAETEKTNYTLNQLMKKKYGNVLYFPQDFLSYEERKTLYEHFLNVEKYNFNRIKWVKYTRSREDGTPTMKADEETRLQYPEDSESTSLETLANMFQPYLQNYIIPYSLYAGLILDGRLSEDDSSRQLKFGYEMIKSLYHDIQVNQYNVESYTKTTSQNVYDIIDITVSHTVTYTGGQVTYSSDKTTTENVTSSCVKDNLVTISQSNDKDVRYRLKYAKVFDKYIINEYKYTEYDLNNEPDDQTIFRNIYKDDNYNLYESGNIQIPQANYNFEYNEYGIIKDGTYTATHTITAKKGYTDTITSTWKDLLEQVSHEERAYTVDDVEESLNGKELSSSEESYYRKYEYLNESDNLLERLNTFDIINANRTIYTNYLRNGENYSENIGYPRSWFVFSYDSLKQAVKKITKSDSGWKYFYGSSLGIDEATSVSSTRTNSSASLSDVDYSGLPAGKLGWPSPGNMTISSCYGARGEGWHHGIDISMPSGSTFVAAAAGEVVSVKKDCTDNYGKADALDRDGSEFCGNGAGNYVKIKVDNSDIYLVYMHMTEVTVNQGEHVEAGQAIGTCGSTGRSTGPHAHFEVRVGGASQSYSKNPCGFFDSEYCNGKCGN